MSVHYYYIDSSCGSDFQVLFKRAQSFAARALERLDDPADSKFAEVFELIFKTPITDARPLGRSPAFQPAPGQDREAELRPRSVLAHVRRELRSFASCWARTPARGEAEVRMHWDGMGRYAKVLPAMFLDPVNYLVRNIGEDVMEDLFTHATATVTSELPVELRLTPDNHHPRRVVIDFTKKAWETQISWEAVEATNLAGLSIDVVADDLLETTIIHEMMHCHAYRLLDFPGDNRATSGWCYLTGLTREQSYICAESIAILCLVAALGDLKPDGLPSASSYILSSDGTIIGCEEMQDWTLV